MSKLLFSTVFFFSYLISWAQPANDLCSNSQVVIPNGTCINGTTSSASDSEPGTDGCQGGNPNRHYDVWYSFVATGTSFSLNVTPGTATDLEILLIDACGGSLIASDCATGTASASLNLTGLTPGTTYTFAIATYDNDGTFQVCPLSFTPTVNDGCDGSIASPTDSSCINSSNFNSSPSFGSSAVGCSPAGSHDTWYSFVATGTQFSYGLSGASGDIGVTLFDDATCASGSFTILNSWCGTNSVSGTYNGLTIGNTYHYIVSTDPGEETNFTICTNNTNPPSIAPNTDCATATPLCSSSTQSGNSNGAGVQELDASNQGCISFGGEKESSWYTFTVQTSGTFEMEISPDNGTDDYDFALWGPNPNCSPTNTPVRCDFSGGGGNTGISTTNGGTGPSNDAGGNNWVTTIDVIAGEQYVLLINNFSATTSPFQLNFDGTASLDCTVLPVSLTSFTGIRTDVGNRLYWNTASESNNNFFSIEHSEDGKNWRLINTVKGAGSTTHPQDYYFDHNQASKKVDYYRLSQTDFDGKTKNLKAISIHYNDSSSKSIIKTVNLMGQEVNSSYSGIVIDFFNDGTSTKRIQ